MSVPTIVIIVAVLALIVALAARRSGPRVTQITRTARKEEEGDA